jgi:hypothetical protein
MSELPRWRSNYSSAGRYEPRSASSISVGDYITAYGNYQRGYRPTLSHCTPIGTEANLTELHNELTDRGVTHRLTEGVNFVWMD